MKCLLDLSPYFQDFVSKKVWKKTAALAQIMPEVLEDYFPHLSLLHLEKRNLLCLEDFDGRRWKVWCSRDNTFDISASLTKGIGRNKESFDSLFDAKSKYSGFIFVTLKDVENVIVRFEDWKSLSVDENCKVVFIE